MIIITSKEQQDQRVYMHSTGKYTSLFYFLEIKSSDFLRPTEITGVGRWHFPVQTSYTLAFLFPCLNQVYLFMYLLNFNYTDLNIQIVDKLTIK